jgi:hypothetical protein
LKILAKAFKKKKKKKKQLTWLKVHIKREEFLLRSIKDMKLNSNGSLLFEATTIEGAGSFAK